MNSAERKVRERYPGAEVMSHGAHKGFIIWPRIRDGAPMLTPLGRGRSAKLAWKDAASRLAAAPATMEEQ